MPLASGPNSVRKNMHELLHSPIQSSSRRKGIRTLAKRQGISFEQARIRQAQAIAMQKSREK